MTEERELVLALCHEVGNLLAASQLESHLLLDPMDGTRVSGGARRIGAISARAGSLVSQIRPLLAPVGKEARSDPLEVLDGLRRGLDEESATRVRVELKSAAALPEVAMDPEILHQVLLTAVYSSLEADPSGRVHVAASSVDDAVRVCVEDGGEKPEGGPDAALRGRPLTHTVARALLAPFGASLEVEASGDVTRVAVTVRVAS